MDIEQMGQAGNEVNDVPGIEVELWWEPRVTVYATDKPGDSLTLPRLPADGGLKPLYARVQLTNSVSSGDLSHVLAAAQPEIDGVVADLARFVGANRVGDRPGEYEEEGYRPGH